MITEYLLKKFVPELRSEKTGDASAVAVIPDQEMRKKIGTLGSATGMVLNILLSVMKMLLGFLIGSVAITADGVNNLSDAGGSLVALISVRMAQKPQDEDHPFGHGRIEYLGALVVGVLIAFFGVELIKSGVESILAGKASAFSVLSFVLLVAGVIVKAWMSVFYRRLGKMTDNPTLLAAAKDSMGDAVSTSVITVATLVSHVTGWPLDGYAGVLVALLVLKAAWDVLSDTVNRLLGGKPDRELGQKIVQMLTDYPGILGVHDLVIHDYGPGRCMASVHAEVDSRSNLVEIHEVIDTAEREMGETLLLPICIHMDPVVSGDEKTEEAKEQMAAYLSSLQPPLHLHDFRRVPGDKNINLIFDVVLPADVHKTDALLSGIQAHASTMDARYRCVVHFDRDYFGTSTH